MAPTRDVLVMISFEKYPINNTFQTLLFAGISGAIEARGLRPSVDPDHLERTQTLMLKYEAMDAADASLVVLSEIYPDAKVEIPTGFAQDDFAGVERSANLRRSNSTHAIGRTRLANR